MLEVLGVKVLCSDSFGRADKINNGISLLIDYDVNNKEDADKVYAKHFKFSMHSCFLRFFLSHTKM
jgi:PhnB protein